MEQNDVNSTQPDGITMGRDLLFDALDGHHHLCDLYDGMLGETELDKALKQTTDVVRTIMEAERATVYVIKEETQELEAFAVIGSVSHLIRLPVAMNSLAGYCAARREAFLIPDAYGDLSHIHKSLVFDRSWDLRNNFRTRDVMCAPAEFHGRILGVVQVMNSSHGLFDSSYLKLLQSMARFVAYALYYAKLHDELVTLKQLDREKAEFTRMLVHEIKAPVAASRSLSASLQFMNTCDSKTLSVLSRIDKRLDELLGLVDDLLSLSKVRSGKPLGAISEIDLVNAASARCAAYREEASAKGLDFNVDLSATPILMRMDGKAFDLIVSNLVSNAVKYTQQGRVSMQLRANHQWAELTVSDTGMGIPKGDMGSLFREFFRASNARHSRISGTGVGLAGVKELVERFGGNIAIESEEGKGTAFTVRLPISDCSASA